MIYRVFTIDHINSIDPPVSTVAANCIITVVTKAIVVLEPTAADVPALALTYGKKTVDCVAVGTCKIPPVYDTKFFGLANITTNDSPHPPLIAGFTTYVISN